MPRRRRESAVRMLGVPSEPPPMLELKAERPKRKRAPATVGIAYPADTAVLGIDLAAGVSGWAIVRAGELEAAGTFKLPTARTGESRAHFWLRRADALVADVRLLVQTYTPRVVAYEYPDTARPVWSGGSKGREFMVASALGMVEGMFLVLTRTWTAVEIVAVPMTAAKRSATGKPGARKEDVRRAMGKRYGDGDTDTLADLSDDMVDALSIADAVLRRVREA